MTAPLVAGVLAYSGTRGPKVHDEPENQCIFVHEPSAIEEEDTMSQPDPITPERGYTFEDYKNFPDDERWEILEGVAVCMAPPPSGNHQEVSVRNAREDRCRGHAAHGADRIRE